MFVFHISTAALAATTPPHLIAHGWEPWTATQILADLSRDPAAWEAFQRTVVGSALRFGGISADFLHYVDDAVADAAADSTRLITACGWQPEGSSMRTVSTRAYDVETGRLDSASLARETTA